MADNINPDHYKRLPAEVIEIIESAIEGAPSNQDAYLHGQVLKYILRCWNKNGIEDLKKAKWYLDRLIGSLESDEQQKAADLQSLKDKPFGKLKKPKWTPKIGDWVRIKKPSDTKASATSWWPSMDRYNGQIIQVEQVEGDGVVYGAWIFLFDWLEQVEPTLYSDKIPEGYRKLKDSSIEPRRLGDLRWSVSEKRYVEIGVDEIGYANRDNWAACRKVESVIKQSLTTEPPDGWRFIENGEVLRKGDNRWNNYIFWELENQYVGVNASNAFTTKFIRRNRFEVGEKVIDCRTEVVFTVQHFNKEYSVVFVDGVSKGIESKHLAPYIEETK